MFVAIFYDRRNRAVIRSDLLLPINLVETTLVVDSEGARGEWKGRKRQQVFIKEEQVAEFGYKSPNCPSSQNWDKSTSLNDLVFLRLQEVPRGPAVSAPNVD